MGEKTQLPQPSTKRWRLSSALFSLLASACGGGGTSTPSPSSQTPSSPNAPLVTTNFTESPDNTYTANDNTNSELHEADAAGKLIVLAQGGNDIINTGVNDDVIYGGDGDDTISSGDGDDIVRGGRGDDNVNLGAGNDLYVIVGVTSDTFYDDHDLTSFAGTNYDISAVFNADNQTVNDYNFRVFGEIVDGGSGVNTLLAVGEVSFFQFQISNFQHLVVDSQAGISMLQYNNFSTINGAGDSILEIYNHTSIGETYLIEPAKRTISGFSELRIMDSTIKGISTLVFSSPEDLDLNYKIISIYTTGVLLKSSNNEDEFLFSQLDQLLDGAGEIIVEAGSTLIIENFTAFYDDGYRKVGGEGTIIISQTQLFEGAFNGMVFSESTNIVDEFNNQIDIMAYGGQMVESLDVVEYVYFFVRSEYPYEGRGMIQTDISVFYWQGFAGDVSVDYETSTGLSGTLTFSESFEHQKLTWEWEDDDIFNFDVIINISLSNQSDGVIVSDEAIIRIRDNDGDSVHYGTGSDDVFNFDEEWGNAMIYDFENGFDIIDLSQTGLGYDDLSITGEVGGTRIVDSLGNTILLEGIDSTLISIDDFWFV